MIESSYLAPTSSPTVHNSKYANCFGVLETIGSNHDITLFDICGMDNGRFSGVWTREKWLAMLDYYPVNQRYKFVFSAVPDIPYDADATLKEFKRYAQTIRDYNYPVALVSQDGMTPEMIPWSEIDALFIGGSDEHKRGKEGGALIIKAKQLNKWLHIGRVNSGSTIIKHFWMANSWDGMTLGRNPSQQLASIGRAVRWARKQQLSARFCECGRILSPNDVRLGYLICKECERKDGGYFDLSLNRTVFVGNSSR